jgi:hypothetical protein
MNSGVNPNPQRARELYWRQLTHLKTDSVYIRLYRDNRAKWVTRLGILKAVASSGGIGLWVIWKEYAFVWATIIAASQVADALNEELPFSRQHRTASEHMLFLDRLLIDTELEWESVFTGRYADDDILNRQHKLRMLQHEAERKNFPAGLPPRNEALQGMAEREAADYLRAMYHTDGSDG